MKCIRTVSCTYLLSQNSYLQFGIIVKLPSAAVAAARVKKSFDLFGRTFVNRPNTNYRTYWTNKTVGHGGLDGRHQSRLALAGLVMSASLGVGLLFLSKSRVVNAKEVSAPKPEASDESADMVEQQQPSQKKRSFRERRIIAYEDRIRAYSTPDKIFRYFATLQAVHSDGSATIYMTPEDFVRSLTPGIRQPEGLGLDSFKPYYPAMDNPDRLLERRPRDSIFRALGDQALISFSDYVFLLTVLSTPPRQFEIAFRMFDSNADGNLDINDFWRVQAVLRDQTNVGKRHRDHSVTGSTLKQELNSALANYFFGKNGRGELSVARILEFQARLQGELNRIEFDRYNPDSGDCITELSFARLLIAYAGIANEKRKKMLNRVRKAFSGNGAGISFRQYAEFSRLLRCIDDVDMALNFHHIAGAAIDKATFRHVAMSVAGIDLDNHLLDVVFVLFDEDGDGHLSNKEFVSVMKHRSLRGLDKSKDTGLVRTLSAWSMCAQELLLYYFKVHSQ